MDIAPSISAIDCSGVFWVVSDKEFTDVGVDIVFLVEEIFDIFFDEVCFFVFCLLDTGAFLEDTALLDTSAFFELTASERSETAELSSAGESDDTPAVTVPDPAALYMP